MKCPFCGCENETNHCKKCFVVIPVEEPKEESKEETITHRKKYKEMKEYGT